jgi:hypothetical protein
MEYKIAGKMNFGKGSSASYKSNQIPT